MGLYLEMGWNLRWKRSEVWGETGVKSRRVQIEVFHSIRVNLTPCSDLIPWTTLNLTLDLKEVNLTGWWKHFSFHLNSYSKSCTVKSVLIHGRRVSETVRNGHIWAEIRLVMELDWFSKTWFWNGSTSRTVRPYRINMVHIWYIHSKFPRNS